MNARDFKIGATYSATRPHRAFNDSSDGSLVEFEESRFSFINLEKPKDGIPQHLASDDWLLIIRKDKMAANWLKISSVVITGEE